MDGEVNTKTRNLNESEEVDCSEIEAEPRYAGASFFEEESEESIEGKETYFALIYSFAYEGPGKYAIRAERGNQIHYPEVRL